MQDNPEKDSSPWTMMALSREAKAQTDTFTMVTVSPLDQGSGHQFVLTVVISNVVRYVDLSISPLVPQATSGRARVSIFVVCPHSNVSLHQGWLIYTRTYFIHN